MPASALLVQKVNTIVLANQVFNRALSLTMILHEPGTLYSAAYGSRDLARSQPISLDSFFWIASLTKLSTAVATLIAVEQGLVTLDQNVRDIVPELKDLDVLEGFDDNSVPLLRKCTAPISLR